MAARETIYIGAAVLWNSIKNNKSLLIGGGIAGELLAVLWTDGYSTTLESCHKALTSVAHYKFHIGTLLCASLITGIGKVVLYSWSQEIEKAKTPPPSPASSPIPTRVTSEGTSPPGHTPSH